MNRIIFLLFVLFCLQSCTEKRDYPMIPEIEYDSFVLFEKVNSYGDTVLAGELKFTLTDGDGDVGLRTYDTLPPDDTSKVYLIFFEKTNNSYTEIYSEDTLNYRIPYLTPVGNNKNLKAEIIIDFDYFLEPQYYDTVKYDFYIVDRAFNKSNIESTPDFIFR
jgi:hypothetical protein